MSKELNNITNDIMEQIHDKKIKMRPKLYFITGSILTFFGLVSSVIVSVFLFGLIRFFLRAHGPFAGYRLNRIISVFPWWALITAFFGLIIGIYLLRKYDFSFKVNFRIVVIGFVLAVILGGIIIDAIGLNDVLMRRGPMKGLIRQHTQDNNIKDGRSVVPGWGGDR